ncbi:MAG: SocA family protein [Chitinispirillales bacterium]|jgi:uncharacterized phage-associated protein|nr:SocA family protein [Chitinispirillales bacterium]
MVKLPSVRKILQALYYLQSNAPFDNNDRFNRVYLLKMLYFSDRHHLRHFGCLATDDTYIAMKLGPVASTASNILKRVTYNINSAEIDYLSYVKDLSENEVEIMTQNNDELSESFKESLDFSLREFGRYSWTTQSAFSHNYPEWKKHGTKLSYVNPSIIMEIEDFFDDPEDDTWLSKFEKDCDPFKEDKEFLAILKEDLNADSVSA